MAGNHRQIGSQANRRLLIAMVLVVGWVTLHTWQATPPRVALVPRSSISMPRLELAEHDTVPEYPWLRDSGACLAEPPQAARKQASPWQASYQEHSYWQPVASDSITIPGIQVEPSRIERELFFNTLNAEHRWFKNQIAHVQDRPTLWQWLPRQCWNAASGLPLAWWQPCQQQAPPTRIARSAARYASPPSLLHGPLLTSPRDRLAMRTPLPSTTIVTDPKDWNDQLLDATRPWMRASLDHSLGEKYLAEPRALRQLLCRLAVEPYARDWALGTLAEVNRTVQQSSRAVVPTRRQLEQLAYRSLQAEGLAVEAPTPGLATQLRRARYALWRRIEVWQAVSLVVSQPPRDCYLASGSTEFPPRATGRISTCTPVPVEQLLAEVEAYESAPTTARSAMLHQRIAQLFEAPSLARHELATTLSDHYHNANARVAITDDLLNRWIPKSEPSVEPVRDRILGTPVRGQATTNMSTTISLLPDPTTWRLGLEVIGQANSSTVAFERTVRVRTEGKTTFAARQQVLISPQGVFAGDVVADAQSLSRFRNARSDYDGLPLVGDIVRSKAASAFSKRRRRAQSEVSDKAKQRVRQQMDNKVRDGLARARGEWNSRVVDPLASGGVAIEPVEMRTTNERLVARVRIVCDNNLAAHTPRPRAPSDSLASIQLHESALTNIACGLNLAGRRFTIEELLDRFDDTVPALRDKALDADAREATIEFAEGTPVTIKLAEGKLHVAWNIRELTVRGRATRNFKLHVYFAPATNGLVAQFRHQAGPYFEGKLRNTQRMRLQTIFGKVFPPDSQFTLGEQYAGDPRLAGLMITQMVIDDGWLGMAVGPAQQARTAQLDRYAPLWR